MNLEGGDKEDFSNKETFNSFNAEELINGAIRDGTLRKEVYERKDIQEFLKNIQLADAMVWGSKIDNWNVWKIILGREDVTFDDALRCAEEQQDSKVWQIVLERVDIQNYLNNIPVNDAIDYVKKYTSYAVGEFIFKRLDIQELIKSDPSV